VRCCGFGLADRLRSGDVHDLDQLDARQRLAHPRMVARRDPIDQLKHVGAAAPGVGDDAVRAGLAGQQEGRDRRSHRGGDPRDHFVVDVTRPARHGANQTERVGALRNREPRLGERSDATNLDAGTFHVATCSERRAFRPTRRA
jgi:hypothetical protein